MLPVGAVDEYLPGAIDVCLGRAFSLEISRLPPRPEPQAAYDRARRQFASTAILHALAAACPGDAARLLGVTGCDLFIPMLSFVYGQAQLGGRVALLSVARLRQEFYGLPANTGITVERTIKETMHEMGHTFGLTHCMDRACAMTLSTTLQQLDRKTSDYCTSCAIMLQEALEMERTEARS